MRTKFILMIIVCIAHTMGFSQQNKTTQKKQTAQTVVAGGLIAGAITATIIKNSKQKKEINNAKAPAAAVNGPKPKIWALIIGVSEYKDKSIPSLKFAHSDAIAFYNFMMTSKAGSVPKENMILLTNEDATRLSILKAARDLFLQASKEDLILFYFSGHGMQGELENTGYLLGSETQNDAVDETAVAMSEIKTIIDRSKARKKISYIDACHAGLFRSDGKKGAYQNDATVLATLLYNADDANMVFMSSTGRQQSIEKAEINGGVFTHFLLRGLAGAADSAQQGAKGYLDGVVTIGEMKSYLTASIQRYTSAAQTPSYSAEGYDEDFPLSVTKSKFSLEDKIQIAQSQFKNNISNTNSSISQNSREQNNNTPVNSYPQTVSLSGNKCHGQGLCYGFYCFVNRFNEPLLLYKVLGAYYNQVDLILPPGEQVCSGRITIANYQNNDCVPADKEIEFYFRTKDETKPYKYATRVLLVEACKETTIELTPNNLNLAKDGKH